MASLATNLACWANNDDTRIAQLQEWRDQALLQVVADGGRSVVQATSNNMAVTFGSANGMSSSSDWLNALNDALAILNNGGPLPKKKTAYFPTPQDQAQ